MCRCGNWAAGGATIETMPESQDTLPRISGSSASEGLSQLVARILNQLAISAWLPSAAMVLLLAFITQLGAALDSAPAGDHDSWFDAIIAAFGNLGGMSAGSFFLLAAAVIVLTMLTQAFTFEAIRLLEGYWGSLWPMRWVAHGMCAWHRWRMGGMEKRRSTMACRAWESAEGKIRAEQHAQGELTCRMISALRQVVCQQGPKISLTPDEEDRLLGYNWTRHATAEPLRLEMVAAKRLQDYPAAHHVLPTRLGNVLRRFEDDTGQQAIESLVEERFDRLPFSLQLSHDELRGRLDLYCSMTLVWLFVAAVAVARFAWTDEAPYGWWLAGVCVAAAWFTYRAAVASSRHYGPVLVRIAQYPMNSAISEPTTGERESDASGPRKGWFLRRSR